MLLGSLMPSCWATLTMRNSSVAKSSSATLAESAGKAWHGHAVARRVRAGAASCQGQGAAPPAPAGTAHAMVLAARNSQAYNSE
jgi:hypothetical protein